MWKTPAFWYSKDSDKFNATALLLSPFSALYALGFKIDQSRAQFNEVNIPVMCVGNLVAGGAGKSIAAQSLMQLILKHQLSIAPYFLSRGYGGTLTGPVQIDPAQHMHDLCGDEPLLLNKTAPTIISQNRYLGAKLAQENNASCVIMDDGLQNKDLKRDINFVIIDGTMGFGNGKLLPAGPLREPLETGLQKADAFILIGEDKHGVEKTLPASVPVFRASYASEIKDQNGKHAAFTGIGFPQKFFDHLREMNVELEETFPFADHHPYTKAEVQKLLTYAQKKDLKLLTTEKDWIKLQDYKTDFPDLESLCIPVPVTLKWQDEDALITFLKSGLTK